MQDYWILQKGVKLINDLFLVATLNYKILKLVDTK